MNYNDIIILNTALNVLIALLLMAIWNNIRKIKQKICGVDIHVVKANGQRKD